MTAANSYVRTDSIRHAVSDREIEIFDALGIPWTGGSTHIRCPYPDHPDREPSWRWDNKRKVAFCTCIGSRPGEEKGHSIFGVVAAKEGLDREAAKIRVAEIVGRPDLIVPVNSQKYQRTDASALLNPPPGNRDDTLPWNYLGHRLGIEPARVPRPATKVVGIKSLAYFDPPRRRDGKPVHVGDFPAAVFETADIDGKTHAHRIYLAPGGAGKAELGIGPNGERRKPKKAARKTVDESTAGRAVIWGDPSRAEIELIFEGIETAAAAALVFQTEIGNSEMVIIACITAVGMEAFKPWPSAKRIIVGADRDMRLPTKGGPAHDAERSPRRISRPSITASSRSHSRCLASRARNWIGSTCSGATEIKLCAAVSSRPYRSSLKEVTIHRMRRTSAASTRA
jgi:hypothetical protein